MQCGVAAASRLVTPLITSLALGGARHCQEGGRKLMQDGQPCELSGGVVSRVSVLVGALSSHPCLTTYQPPVHPFSSPPNRRRCCSVLHFISESKIKISVMAFKLLEVDLANDFDQVIECQWVSYEKPYQSFFRLFCPLLGDGLSAREESLKESTARQLAWHNGDSTSYWAKVVNNDGIIVGACLWKICPTNPFEDYKAHDDADWHPEGERREYVSRCLEQFDLPRSKMGARPQVCKSSWLSSTPQLTLHQTSTSSTPTQTTAAKASPT